MDNGSTAGCGGYETSLSRSVFNYTHLGENEIDFIVKDGRGNTAAAKVMVNVMDTLPPTVVTKPGKIYLNNEGRLNFRGAKSLLVLCEDVLIAKREGAGGFTPDGSQSQQLLFWSRSISGLH